MDFIGCCKDHSSSSSIALYPVVPLPSDVNSILFNVSLFDT